MSRVSPLIFLKIDEWWKRSADLFKQLLPSSSSEVLTLSTTLCVLPPQKLHQGNVSPKCWESLRGGHWRLADSGNLRPVSNQAFKKRYVIIDQNSLAIVFSFFPSFLSFSLSLPSSLPCISFFLFGRQSFISLPGGHSDRLGSVASLGQKL